MSSDESRFDFVQVAGGVRVLPSFEVSQEVVALPCVLIIRGDNDRTEFDPASLNDLALSIQAEGLANPITVRPVERVQDGVCRRCGRVCLCSLPETLYEIVAGERRFRAVADLLKWPKIDAVIRQLDDEQASGLMLLENVHRVDLNPMDEAHAYKKRMDKFTWGIAQIAFHAKVTPRRVSERLALLLLVEEAQKLIRDGQMPVEWGEHMAALDPNRQRIALRYLSSTERPLKREFQAIVGKLMVEQAQEPLLDFTSLEAKAESVIGQALTEHQGEREERYAKRFPVDERLPKMAKRGSIGLTLELYIGQLAMSGDPVQVQAAGVVGRVYESMIETGMAFPPRLEAREGGQKGGKKKRVS